jgi:hypothetical protein
MSENSPKHTLIIRFVGDHEDICIENQDIVTLESITQKVLQVRPDLRGKECIKIVWRGRFVDEHDSFRLEDLMVVHCIIAEGNYNRQQNEVSPLRVGFDRLIDMGFDESEIRELRQHFHLLRGLDPRNRDSSIEVEESWIDSVRNSDEMNHESDFDILKGLVMGFFCGLLIIFWVKESNMFTRKQQQGILTGLLLNIAFGILRLL